MLINDAGNYVVYFFDLLCAFCLVHLVVKPRFYLLTLARIQLISNVSLLVLFVTFVMLRLFIWCAKKLLDEQCDGTIKMYNLYANEKRYQSPITLFCLL